MRVFLLRHYVVLLAAVRAVAMDDKAQLLESVERPVHGRWRHVRVDSSTPLEELHRGDVARRRPQDSEDRAPLWRPAKAPCADLVSDGLGLQR